MATDLLRSAEWVCRASAPDEYDEQSILAGEGWIGAVVPGTAAAALTADGCPPEEVAERAYDNEDWWFRTAFPAADPGPAVLRCDGLATIADVWLNGERVVHSDNMFIGSQALIPSLQADNELIVRFAALGPKLRQRHKRPRWRTPRLPSQHLRWYRTTLFGRMLDAIPVPVPVGPWRDITIAPIRSAAPARAVVRAACDPAGDGGSVDVRVELHGRWDEAGILAVDGTTAVLTREATPIGSSSTLTTYAGSVALPKVRRWWPHTHGEPTLYGVELRIGDRTLDLGRAGFREIEVDRGDDGFSVAVNGVPIFARGACWTPMDPIGLSGTEPKQRAALDQFRAAHLNMVRIPGETVYENDTFYDLCDELGILVWQDCMFSTVDIPDDEDFLASVATELTQVFDRLSRRPSLTVLSGGSELEQSAAMAGVERSELTAPRVRTLIEDLVAQQLPGTPFVASSPTGGVLPIQTDSGVSHYYGVGAYLRPTEDARRSGVRFASECLAFAVPPEPRTVETHCGGAARSGHHPAWKRAVNRDAGASWDFEDVVDHYVGVLFGVDRAQVRYSDPERALDLCRVTVAALVETTMSEWRRPTSPCAGALVLQYRDLVPGAGWGVIDSLGYPKAPWYVLRRVMAPVTVLLTDEGLNGIRAHLVNDGPHAWAGTLRAELFGRHGKICLETSATSVQIPVRGGVTVDLAGTFSGFRDMNHAYRFGPAAFDVVAATLLDDAGVQTAQAMHLPLGQNRPIEDDLDIQAVATKDQTGVWGLELVADRFAQWVTIELDEGHPDDSYFHLLPGQPRCVVLGRSDDPPRGAVRALNSRSRFRIAATDSEA